MRTLKTLLTLLETRLTLPAGGAVTIVVRAGYSGFTKTIVNEGTSALPTAAIMEQIRIAAEAAGFETVAVGRTLVLIRATETDLEPEVSVDSETKDIIATATKVSTTIVQEQRGPDVLPSMLAAATLGAVITHVLSDKKG